MNIIKFIIHGAAGLIGMGILIIAICMVAGAMALADWLRK